MKFFFGVLVLVSLASTLAGPINPSAVDESADPYVRLVQAVRKAKTKEFYAKIEELISKRTPLYAMLENTESDWMLESIQNMKSSGKADAILQVAEVIVQLLKATVPEGANPTDAALTELAKKMSKILRESKPSIFNILPGKRNHASMNGILMVGVVKDIIANHPLLSEGNNFVEMLKEKSVKLSLFVKDIRQYNAMMKQRLTNSGPENETSTIDKSDLDYVRSFQIVSYIEHTLTRLQSEENAIEAFKGFSVLTAALKNPSSYDSLEAFHEAVSKNKMIEAFSLVMQSVADCTFHQLSSSEKSTVLRSAGDLLPVIKLILADGQELESEALVIAVGTWFMDYMTDLSGILSKIKSHYSNEDSMVNLRQCFLSDSDRALFKQIMLSNTALVPEEKLNELKNKSKFVYGTTQLLNIAVRFDQRLVGLSERAKVFKKEIMTVPNLLFYMSQYASPSQETLAKSIEAKNMVIKKFNDLPADVKMELVDFDPYTFIGVLALLD